MPHPNATGRKFGGDLADKVLLDIEEFMHGYGYGRTSTYTLLNTGKIEAVCDGRRTRIVKASADAYVASLPSYTEARAA